MMLLLSTLVLVVALVAVATITVRAYDHQPYASSRDDDDDDDDDNFSELSVEQAEKLLLQHKVEAALARARALAAEVEDAAAQTAARGTFVGVSGSVSTQSSIDSHQMWTIDPNAGGATTVGSGLGKFTASCLAYDSKTRRLFALGTRLTAATGASHVVPQTSVLLVNARTGIADEFCVLTDAGDNDQALGEIDLADCDVDSETGELIAFGVADGATVTSRFEVALDRAITSISGGKALGACPTDVVDATGDTPALPAAPADPNHVGVVQTPTGLFVLTGSTYTACPNALLRAGDFLDGSCPAERALTGAVTDTDIFTSAAYEPENGSIYALRASRSCADAMEDCVTATDLVSVSHAGVVAKVGASVGVGIRSLAIIPDL